MLIITNIHKIIHLQSIEIQLQQKMPFTQPSNGLKGSSQKKNHMKKILLAFIITIFVTESYSQTQITLDSTKLDKTVVVDSALLDAPWDIDWGFDNRLWISDIKRILVWDTTSKALKVLYTIPKGNALGLCVPEKKPISGKTYVYAVYDTGTYYSTSSWAQLFRFDYDANNDTLINRTLILEYEHHGEHSGGRIVIGKDEKIYLTTADYTYIDTLHQKLGKVLRMNIDGSVPNDNYRGDHTYTSGHRNPQGMVCLPGGEIFISEHGQIQNEINHLKERRNYGWPAFDANNCTNIAIDSCNSATFIANHEPPIIDLDWGFPPAGMDYYNHPAIPELENSIITGRLLTGDSISVAKLNATQNSIIGHETYSLSGTGRIRDICTSPTGEIYLIVRDRANLDVSQPGIVTSDAEIIRLKNPDYVVSVNDIVRQYKLSLYPNPAITELTIDFGVVTNAYQIVITDITGKVVVNLSDNKTTSKATIRLPKLSAGMYIATVTMGTKTHTEKLVIE